MRVSSISVLWNHHVHIHTILEDHDDVAASEKEVTKLIPLLHFITNGQPLGEVA